ncbi:MAG TPA: M20/M25/M40 family metallo-hydrolase [Streptosporangiaceae bacterium]
MNTAATAHDMAAIVLRRTTELARIAAPTGAEQHRAERVRCWWAADGWSPSTDAVGNVWAQVTGGHGPGLLVCAHLDTVFGADVAHEVRAASGRLWGPSVGDDSLGVAALSAAASVVRHGRGTGPFWIVATVGEEGMGNLTGIRHAIATATNPLSAVIAVEGNYLGRIVTTGVGSVRLRVRYRGRGGHAWELADAPSAVHAIARAASIIAGLTVPGARCSVNVGVIGDAPPGLSVEVEDLGRRPAGSISVSSPMVRAAIAALGNSGIAAQISAASTDANAAYEAGISGLAVGVTTGAGEHTPAEWIETAPVATGLTVLAETIELVREGRE